MHRIFRHVRDAFLRLPFLRDRQRHVRFAAARRLLADAGMVAFVAVGILGGILAIAEFLAPGFAAHYVAPQTLGFVAAVSGAAALLGDSRTERGVVHGTAYVLLGSAAALLVGFVAWYYFASVPNLAGWVPFGAAAMTGLIFFVSYPGRE